LAKVQPVARLNAVSGDDLDEPVVSDAGLFELAGEDCLGEVEGPAGRVIDARYLEPRPAHGDVELVVLAVANTS